MIRKILFVGSTLCLVAAVLGLISGHYFPALVIALIGVWGFSSIGRKKTAFDEIVESGVQVPPTDELKQFRREHPDLSFSEAILAFNDSQR